MITFIIHPAMYMPATEQKAMQAARTRIEDEKLSALRNLIYLESEEEYIACLGKLTTSSKPMVKGDTQYQAYSLEKELICIVTEPVIEVKDGRAYASFSVYRGDEEDFFFGKKQVLTHKIESSPVRARLDPR